MTDLTDLTDLTGTFLYSLCGFVFVEKVKFSLRLGVNYFNCSMTAVVIDMTVKILSELTKIIATNVTQHRGNHKALPLQKISCVTSVMSKFEVTQLIGKSTSPCGYRRSPSKGGKPFFLIFRPLWRGQPERLGEVL